MHLICEAGGEEIYIQSHLGVPLDLWPGQTDGANTLYLFNSFDARSNPAGNLLDVQNHGASQFAVGNTKTTIATPLDVAGLTTLYGGLVAPTNMAPHTTVAPANLHSVTLGKGWTNDFGVRADLVISVKYTDAATGDPAFSFTNSITGEAWTNSVAFGLTATTKSTVVIPDISPGDYGKFSDLSGTGASVNFLSAWWKLK